MRKPALLQQLLAVNAALTAAAVLAAIAAVRLDLQLGDQRRQVAVLAAAVLVTILANGVVLRRRLNPLGDVIDAMEAVDLTHPGLRVDTEPADSDEVERLRRAFNRMLARLEEERAGVAGAVLRAQEEERARLARDLHDEVNQALTAVLLRLQASAQNAPPELAAELHETQRVAAQAMEELLRLARELRPAALDDHGLTAALRTQVDRFAGQTGIAVKLDVDDEVEQLGEVEQLVVYRVVQESLSNVARHSRAARVDVEARRTEDGLRVRIADDGCGIAPPAQRRRDGVGLTGMRERALLAGGHVDVHSSPDGGTTVELVLCGS